MSDEFNKRHRTILVKLLHTAQSKTSANSLIAELQRQKEKFSKKSLHIILLDIAKIDKLAEQIYKELQKDSKSSDISAFDFLQTFLSTYEKSKFTRKVSSRHNIETIAEDENCSMLQKTHNMEQAIDCNGRDNGIEKTSTDCLNKSIHTSTLYESIQNNNTSRADVRIHSRLFFSKAVIDSLSSQIIQPNCAARSVAEQEQILIDELMYSFVGLPGDFITPQINDDDDNQPLQYSFKISDHIDVSLRNIAQDLLPMASHYSTIQKFVQWGDKVKNQILHALSEVIQILLNDYRLSITQLEKEKVNNNLTLHKLHYLIRPNAQKLYILSELVEKIQKSDLKSGTILSILYDEITLQTGDQISQKMLVELTESASVPYIEMLEKWILKGVIIDPHGQFFVVDHVNELGGRDSQMDRARYWESRYTIQIDRTPRFLQNDADIVLRTGKYLNVIRECGREIILPVNTTKLNFSATSSSHSIFIKQAYLNASKTLLELLMNELNLMGHISSVKRYFLLQQGDLITQFMDASEEELSKNVDKVTPVRLDNLLQLIIRLSSAKNDPCIEHLHCNLFTMDLMEQISKMNVEYQLNGNLTDSENFNLSGLECFAFGYSVDWPVSIVLNQWTLAQYQILFRLLFYCKHVERQLYKVWIEICAVSKRLPKEQKTQWRTAFALRQRMLNAIHHFENYMMIEVIEPNWHTFTERMKTVNSIDEVLNIHSEFLHSCIQNCCLNHPNILEGVISMCDVCLHFAKFIQSDAGLKVSSSWQTIIDGHGNEFDKFLFQILNRINGMTCEEMAGAKLINLVHRINFNGYYSEKLP